MSIAEKREDKINLRLDKLVCLNLKIRDYETESKDLYENQGGRIMYTAVMEYHFKKEHFVNACETWNNEVIELAKQQPGFVRMQLMTRDGEYALAIGTWGKQEDAQNFMKTGIFKDLLEKFADMLVDTPSPTIWDTIYYAEAE